MHQQNFDELGNDLNKKIPIFPQMIFAILLYSNHRNLKHAICNIE